MAPYLPMANKTPMKQTPSTQQALDDTPALVAPAVPQADHFPQVVVNIPPTATNAGVADVLTGIAAILWPIVIALIVIMFRREIISLARRIRRGSAFGAEAEFEQELDALHQEAKKAKEDSVAVPEAYAKEGSIIEDLEDSKSDKASVDEIHQSVLAEASRSPRLGLMLLSAEIDRKARKIALSTGYHQQTSLKEQLRLWDSQLPQHASAAYRLFSHIRNRIVHGRNAEEAEIFSAIDSGLMLYEALSLIPIEQNIVAHPGVDVFNDPKGEKLLECKGLIIETTHQGKRNFRIFPTTKSDYYIGMPLTWEWNMSRVWEKAWYRDTETGEIKTAWHSSAEFVGRDLDQI